MDKIILLVESNPDDELMTLHALEETSIKNKVVVARDGEEALDYMLTAGAYDTRNANTIPEIVLLEPKLPKVDGFEVLKRLRADERTRHLPVAIFASSDEEQNLMESYGPDGNVYVRKPLDFAQLSRVVRQLGLRWMVLDGS